MDQLVFDHLGVGHGHDDEAVFAHHQQVIPGDENPLPSGGEGEGGVVGELTHQLARLVNDPVQLPHLQVHGLIDPLGLLKGELVLFHQLVDVEAVAQWRGNPSGGGVGLLQVAQLLQGRHLIADGGGAAVQVRQLSDDLGTHRLGGFNIMLYHCAKNLSSALGHLHGFVT